MIDRVEWRRESFRRAAVIGAWGVAALGASVLVIGWGLGVESLQRPFPVGGPMKANSAVGVSLLALALLLRIREDASVDRVRASTLTCLLVILASGAPILELVLGADLSIDRLLMSAADAVDQPGRMPSSTAFSLLLLASGIIAIDGRRWATVLPTLSALIIGFVAVSGYVLGIESMYGVGEFTGMAAHTALSLLLLALSVLGARPERDPIVRLTWSDSGGTVARRLIPTFVVLFMAVTWIMENAVAAPDEGIPLEVLLLDNVLLTSLLVVLAWHLSGVLHDSEQRRREITENTMREKDRFMASVGHELRTPVSALVGFADLLNEMGGDLPPEEQGRILELMAEQGADLVALLEDLLVAARSDAGSLSVARVRVDLRAQVAQALESLVAESPPVEEIRGEGVHVVGDPLRVRQIMRNLLSNAARYGGGSIRITVGRVDRTGFVRVADDGDGIPPEATARLFEPYVTLHGEAGRPGSVGLGLPVARNLALRMGGDLHYRRESGWSVFEVELPVYEAAGQVSAPSGREPEVVAH